MFINRHQLLLSVALLLHPASAQLLGGGGRTTAAWPVRVLSESDPPIRNNVCFPRDDARGAAQNVKAYHPAGLSMIAQSVRATSHTIELFNLIN